MAEWKAFRSRNKRIRQLRQNGYGLREISSILNCPKSTVKYYADRISVSSDKSRALKRIKENAENGRLAGELKWKRRKEEITKESKKDWATLKNDPRFMAFLGIYWGEGFKTGHIGIVNNDPSMILAGLLAFKRLNPESHVVATIFCYPDHQKTECANFWMNLLKGAEIRIRNVSDKRSGKKPHKSPHGLCRLEYSDWRTFTKIMTWLECWKQDLKAGVV